MVLSRRPGTGTGWCRGDLATGEGLREAIVGIEGVAYPYHQAKLAAGR